MPKTRINRTGEVLSISGAHLNKVLGEINEAFADIEARVEALENPPKTVRKTTKKSEDKESS